MTYAAAKIVSGREPFQIVELDLDTCSLTWSVLPCTASGSAGSECYNTRKTCQDTPNYARATKTYRFSPDGVRLPIGDDLIPCIESVVLRSPEINPVESIGVRGSATVTFKDFPYHDRAVDKYVDNRLYTPENQGTYFGKLRARTPFYAGRVMRVYTGFYTDPFDTANFQVHEYQIESMEGPDSRGKVIIKGKDPLKLTEKKQALCPVPNSGLLLSAITGTPSTFTLTPSGIGNSEYAASGYVRIQDEIIQFTRSADVMTIVARASWGTTSDDHDADEVVQQCKSWSAINVVDILDDLIRDFTNINTAYIDTAGWATQKSQLLSSQSLTAIISEPTGVKTLLDELIAANLFDMWWDDRNSLIKIRSFIPNNVNEPPTPLGDDYHFIRNKTKRKDRHERRVTQVRVIYEPRDYTKFENNEDYSYAYIATDSDAGSADQYNDSQIKTIFCRWFNLNNRAQAIALASRLLQRFRDAPIEISFSLDVKDDDLAIGDNFRTDTKSNQAADGSNSEVWMQVVSVQEDVKNSLVKYKALSLELVGPYGYVAPNGTVDYGSASNAEKAAYAWICLDTGLFSNGDDGYLIL